MDLFQHCRSSAYYGQTGVTVNKILKSPLYIGERHCKRTGEVYEASNDYYENIVMTFWIK